MGRSIGHQGQADGGQANNPTDISQLEEMAVREKDPTGLGEDIAKLGIEEYQAYLDGSTTGAPRPRKSKEKRQDFGESKAIEELGPK